MSFFRRKAFEASLLSQQWKVLPEDVKFTRKPPDSKSVSKTSVSSLLMVFTAAMLDYRRTKCPFFWNKHCFFIVSVIQHGHRENHQSVYI